MIVKGLAMVAAAVATLSCASLVETTYTMKACVTDVQDTKVEVIDEAGKEWEFYADNISVNDTIKLVFDDGHTHNRQDDVIKNYYKIIE